jgi:hypothetical protein
MSEQFGFECCTVLLAVDILIYTSCPSPGQARVGFLIFGPYVHIPYIIITPHRLKKLVMQVESEVRAFRLFFRRLTDSIARAEWRITSHSYRYQVR